MPNQRLKYLVIHNSQMSPNLSLFFCREGRNFCRISILEDCSIKYKALHHLDRLLRGDFLANSNFIVSKHGDKIMYLQLEPHYKIFEVKQLEIKAKLEKCREVRFFD